MGEQKTIELICLNFGDSKFGIYVRILLISMTTKLLKLEYQPTLKSTKVTGIQSRHLKYFILYSSIKLILACDNNLSGSKPFRSSKTAANYSNSQSNPTFRQIIQYDQTANRSNFEEIQMRSFQVHHKNFYMMSTFNQYCMNAFG